MLTMNKFLTSGRLEATVSEREFKNLFGQAGSGSIKEDKLCLELYWGGKYDEEKFPPGIDGSCLPWPGKWITEYDGYTYKCSRIVLLQLTPDILVQLTIPGPNYDS